MKEHVGYPDLSTEECEIIRYVSDCWVRRAAHMVSASIATLINRIDEKKITVAIDGSLYRFHPNFHNLMMEYMEPLVTPGISVSQVTGNTSVRFTSRNSMEQCP